MKLPLAPRIIVVVDADEVAPLMHGGLKSWKGYRLPSYEAEIPRITYVQKYYYSPEHTTQQSVYTVNRGSVYDRS